MAAALALARNNELLISNSAEMLEKFALQDFKSRYEFGWRFEIWRWGLASQLRICGVTSSLWHHDLKFVKE